VCIHLYPHPQDVCLSGHTTTSVPPCMCYNVSHSVAVCSSLFASVVWAGCVPICWLAEVDLLFAVLACKVAACSAGVHSGLAVCGHGFTQPHSVCVCACQGPPALPRSHVPVNDGSHSVAVCSSLFLCFVVWDACRSAGFFLSGCQSDLAACSASLQSGLAACGLRAWIYALHRSMPLAPVLHVCACQEPPALLPALVRCL
jgi:hypothetical protein